MYDLSLHLKDAIALNTHRMPLYGELTNGQTIPFSRILIRYEKFALYGGSWFFDWVGNKLQSKGIPYLEEEFVTMSTVPDFCPQYPDDIDFLIPLQRINTRTLSNEIKTGILTRNFDSISRTCKAFLAENLNNQPHVYCMLRHLLESMARISALVPIQEARCNNLGLTPPTNYTVWLLKSHYWLLQHATELDQRVAPIQRMGVPFLFQDLPQIPLV